MKSIGELTGPGSAYDNIDNPDIRIKSYLHPFPIYMNVHLDVICTRGNFTYESGGVKHCCPEGTITIITKDSICRFISASDDCRIAVLMSDTNRLHLGATPYHNLILFQSHVKESPTFLLSAKEMESVLGIYRTVKNFSESSDCRHYEDICQLQHASLFYFLFGKIGIQIREGRQGAGHGNSISRTFMANVAEHFREERKLDFYANLQCITTKHLSSAVKKECGIQAHQIIAEYVMIEAKSLLADKSLSIFDISETLHFPNQSFFGKFFKAHEGLSPLQYRANIL